MFINTAIIPFIVKFRKDRWFDVGGLASDAFLIVFTMNFVSPTINLICFPYIIKRIKLKYQIWKGEKSKMTQREANKLAEGVDFDTPFLFASTIVTFAITCFFTPLIPMLPIISFIGLLYKYCIDKYLLLRRCKLPQEMADQMSMTLTGLIPIMLFFYALGQFIFITDLSKGENKLPHLTLWLSLVLAIIPFRLLFKNCEGRISRDDSETYIKNKAKFLTNYDR